MEGVVEMGRDVVGRGKGVMGMEVGVGVRARVERARVVVGRETEGWDLGGMAWEVVVREREVRARVVVVVRGRVGWDWAVMAMEARGREGEALDLGAKAPEGWVRVRVGMGREVRERVVVAREREGLDLGVSAREREAVEERVMEGWGWVVLGWEGLEMLRVSVTKACGKMS